MTSEDSNEVNLQIVIKPARPSTLETSNFGINRSIESFHLITFFFLNQIVLSNIIILGNHQVINIDALN